MNFTRLFLAAFAVAHVTVALADDGLSAGKYELKNRSEFSIPNAARPPFWPIGWVRRDLSTAPAAAAPVQALDEKSFVVTSILVGNPSLAVINGRAYTEGEFVRLPKASGATGRVRVQRIADGTVQLQTPVQMITASLRRAELGPKKSEEELLSDDR